MLLISLALSSALQIQDPPVTQAAAPPACRLVEDHARAENWRQTMDHLSAPFVRQWLVQSVIVDGEDGPRRIMANAMIPYSNEFLTRHDTSPQYDMLLNSPFRTTPYAPSVRDMRWVWPAGLLPFQGRLYRVTMWPEYGGASFRGSGVFIDFLETEDAILCVFRSEVQEEMRRRGYRAGPNICERLAAGEAQEIQPDRDLPEGFDDLFYRTTQFFENRREIHPRPRPYMRVDIDQDGELENLISLRYSPGNRFPVPVTYIDVLNEDLTGFSDAPVREAFLALQRVDADRADQGGPPARGADAFHSMHLWRLDDQLLLERRGFSLAADMPHPGSNPEARTVRPKMSRQIYLLNGEDNPMVCESRFTVTTHIDWINDEYLQSNPATPQALDP